MSKAYRDVEGDVWRECDEGGWLCEDAYLETLEQVENILGPLTEVEDE